MISLLFSKKGVNFTPKYNLIVAAFEIIQNKGGIKKLGTQVENGYKKSPQVNHSLIIQNPPLDNGVQYSELRAWPGNTGKWPHCAQHQQHQAPLASNTSRPAEGQRWKDSLGKPSNSKTDEFSEKFRRGGGGHFQSKNLYCWFLPL